VTETGTTPGSQSALRQANERRVVDVLRRDGTQTQAELARATGLSAASVSNIVRGLRAEGHDDEGPLEERRRALRVWPDETMYRSSRWAFRWLAWSC
jgi:DNA-binding MarR family transcriptional regulator